jgi:hypothetical protein
MIRWSVKYTVTPWKRCCMVNVSFWLTEWQALFTLSHSMIGWRNRQVLNFWRGLSFIQNQISHLCQQSRHPFNLNFIKYI